MWTSFKSLFQGRLTRREYLVGVLTYTLVIGVTLACLRLVIQTLFPIVAEVLPEIDLNIASFLPLLGTSIANTLLAFLLGASVLFLYITMSIRRLHDMNHPGLWIIFAFVPYLGIIFVLYLFLGSSNIEGNKYAPNPSGRPLLGKGIFFNNWPQHKAPTMIGGSKWIAQFRRTLLVPILIIVSAIIFIFLFIYNIGLNNKYFIERDFNSMFHARQTGNCEEFVSYIAQDRDDWLNRCVEERSGKKEDVRGIRSFEIKEIGINDDKAFLQVELQRDVYDLEAKLADDGHKLPQGGYLVNYQMKRVGTTWYLDQPFSN